MSSFIVYVVCQGYLHLLLLYHEICLRLCCDVIIWVLWLQARVKISVRLIYTIKTSFNHACVLETCGSITLKSFIRTWWILLPRQKPDSCQVLCYYRLVNWRYQRWLTLVQPVWSSWVTGQVTACMLLLHEPSATLSRWLRASKLLVLNGGWISPLWLALQLANCVLEVPWEVLGEWLLN